MGDCQNGELRVDFDGRLKLRFVGSQVTTDAGLLAYRELDEALALTETGADNLQDCRLGQNKQHGLVPLLRQSIYSRLAGYEDVNDAERLCVDPAMRHVVGGRATRPGKCAASTSEVGRFETEIISTPSNLTSLMDLSGRWIDKVRQRIPLKELILDMDSSVSETYGDQQGSAYNGHFECTCYHPLFLFNQFGDLERAMLRRGHHHSAKFWRRVLLPVIERYRSDNIPKFFRGDAAFANPALYRLLENEGLSVRHPHPGQRRAGTGNRPPSPAAGGSSAPQADRTLRWLPVPRGELGCTPPCRGEGRVASRRVVPARRFRCHEHLEASRGRHSLLQWPGHGRTMDQGGQVRAQVDEALLPHVPGQPDSSAALRPGLQPRQLPAQAGFAETGATLVTDDAAGKADQDRSEDRATRPLRDVPDGRSGDPTPAVPGDSAKYRTAQDDTASAETGMTEKHVCLFGDK